MDGQLSIDVARKLPLVRAVKKPFPGKMAQQTAGASCMVMEYSRLQGWLVRQVIPLH